MALPSTSTSAAGAVANPQTLRDFAVQSLLNLLSLHAAAWKVLVLDARAQDILATTLRVQDLRDQGVTLHMFASRA